MSEYKAEYGEHGLNIYKDDVPMDTKEIEDALNEPEELRAEIEASVDIISDLTAEKERLEDRVEELKALCKEADDYLNTNNQTRIDHGSILHGKFAEAWRDFDAHEHDGVACSPGCRGHHSHPCEKCGRQWPVRIKQ